MINFIINPKDQKNILELKKKRCVFYDLFLRKALDVFSYFNRVLEISVNLRNMIGCGVEKSECMCAGRPLMFIVFVLRCIPLSFPFELHGNPPLEAIKTKLNSCRSLYTY